MHKVLIVGGIIVAIIIVILLTNKSSRKLPLFKARMDELDQCHDTCFEQYPFAWQNNKRQNCLTDCIKDEKEENEKKNDNYDFEQCVADTCGDIDKCDLIIDLEERMKCEANYKDCPVACCRSVKKCDMIEDIDQRNLCEESCKMSINE